jgi:chloramphenicol 3-O-phosphotransferase
MTIERIRIGLLWTQFSAYHKDRCEAVGRRLSDRCIVRAVQVSTKSEVYAWEPTADAVGTEAVTLFPGQVFEKIPVHKRLWAEYKALRVCKMVGIGIPYSEKEIILLAWMLRLSGVRVIMMSATKYDDFPVRSGSKCSSACC